MWEAIRRNTRRSYAIVVVMALLLLGLGAMLGYVLFGSEGVIWGLLAAAALWAVLLTITLTGGEDFLLFTAGAREIAKHDAPRLWNVVEEMTIAAGLPTPPRVYILEGYMQNAFAVGRTPERARLVITEGLIRGLNRDELQGVVAHEIAHIKNLDVRFLTFASVMVGSITLLADLCRRTLWFGGRRSRVKGPPHVYIALLVVLLLAAVLGPIFARLLYLACSREREYLADASAARFTRYPAGLASALEKMSERRGVTEAASLTALAPMFIVNPAVRSESMGGWFRTHPPTEERIRILRSMAGAGWVDYEHAYQRIAGGRCLDSALVRSEGSVAFREAAESVDDAPEAAARLKEALGVLEQTVHPAVVACTCGVEVAPPRRFRRRLQCPGCGRRLAIGRPATAPGGERPLVYHRRTSGWEEFRCSCGKRLHVSPALQVEQMRCRGCGREIRIG